MNVLVFIIVILGALLAIASGVWVAFALGSAISSNKDKTPSSKEDDSIIQK